MSLTFDNKVVLVTGSGSGIGKAIAHRFATLGATLVLVDKDEEGVDASKRECLGLSPKKLAPQVIVADLTFDHEIKQAIQTTLDKANRLDVLVNNVGIATPTCISSPSLMIDFDAVFRVNVRAPLYLTQLAAPLLSQTKGCVVNVSSIAAYRPSRNMLPYSMSKAAVTMMTKNLAVDLGSKGIRVNEVNPGAVETNVSRSWKWSEAAVTDYLKQLVKSTPLGQLCLPEDIAKAVTFLASDDASMVNGASFIVDGGFVCSSSGDHSFK